MSKIALPIAELKPALTGLGKVISRRSTLPVLNHLKVERTQDGWVALTATDLDRYITVRLEQPADGGPMVLLVPYTELQNTVKTCSKEDVIVLEKCAQNSITLQYPIGQQTASNKVQSLPVDEFPETPKLKGEPIPVPDQLRNSIHEAMECSSTDETRYILNSAFIDVSDPECHHVVGTDGRILYGSNSFSLPLDSSLIIPRHPFLAWKEFNNDGEWQLRAEPGNKDTLFQIATRRWRYISKQIEGDYPNWRQVVPGPGSFKSSFGIPEAALENVLQTIQRMPCNDSTSHRIGLEFQGRKLHLLGKSAEAEDWTKVEVPVIDRMGEDVTVFIDRRYLATAMKFGLNFIEVIDSLAPLRISNGGRQMLIMPVRPHADPHPQPATRKETEAPAVAREVEETGQSKGDAISIGASPVPETSHPEPPSPQPTADPTGSPPAASTERSTMVNATDSSSTTTTNGANGNGNAATPTTTEEAAPANDIDVVIETIDDLRESLGTNLADLKTVAGKLKQIKKDQKTTEREIQSFRQTLKTLQGVRL